MTKARDLANIITGGFTADDIPNIPASKITSGTFADARIADLDATKLTGTIASGRLGNVDLTNLSASNLTSGTIPDARVSSSAVSQHAVSFDDNAIVNDLSTIALRQATNENAVAYNTNSSFVDVFQDGSGIASHTTSARNSSEYVSTLISSTGQFTSDSNTLLLLHMDGSDNGTTFTDSSSHGRTASVYDQHVTGFPKTKTNIKKFGTSSCYFGDGNGGAGSHGSALSFPDSSSWDFLAGNFTVECWTYLLNGVSASGNTTFGFGGQSTSDSSDSGGNYNFDMNNQQEMRMNVYRRNGSNTNDDLVFNTSATIGLNVWKHLAWVRDGNTFRFYIDGVQQGSDAIPSSVSYRLAQNDLGGKWWISKRPYSNEYGYIRGYVDEYRISNNTRYPNGTTFTPNAVDVTNATGNFISNAITAPSSTSKMGAIITYENTQGTNTLNTDIVLQLSADNGSNFATATLTAMPDFATGIKMAKVNDLSVTAGTQLKYKISFANQSGSKEARIRGVSLQY
jgi:hypothetical protein